MKVFLNVEETSYSVDLSKPIDISIPLRANKKNVNAWYIDSPKIEPVVMGNWIGDVNKGASVNFRNIFFNPHGHGTHTECVGHISKEINSINQTLKTFFFIAELISVTPQKQSNGDEVIKKESIVNAFNSANIEALIIRTKPNNKQKLNKQYSNTNPPYIEKETIEYLLSKKIQHLLIDLPSIDKEKDDGKLEAHHAFWEYPQKPNNNKTITELIYVPNEVKDGLYLLNLQIASFENDASPSKPVLYKLEK